jgi:hypothetical protein
MSGVTARSILPLLYTLLLVLALGPTSEVWPQAPLALTAPTNDALGVEALAMLGGNVLMTTEDTGPGGSWRVDLFDATTAEVIRTFPNPDPAVHGYFGISLATLGSDVVIGASDRDFGVTAAVHLFEGATGAVIRAFANPNPTAIPRNEFGRTVAVLGSDVLVGARLDDTAGPESGAVYQFDGTTGALVRTYLRPGASGGEYFGSALAVVGSNVLIGAQGYGLPAGEAYLFDGATGTLLRTFPNPDAVAPYFPFGSVVAAFGDDVLVSAPDEAVYVFDSATGTVLLTLVNPDPSRFFLFGQAVHVVGNDILVGALGGVFRFDSTGTLLRTIVTNLPAPPAFYSFGFPIAAEGGAVVVAGGFSGAFVFCGGAAGCGRCETCGAGGSCIAGPNPTCHQPTPGKSLLKIKNASPDTGDRLLWRWQGGFGLSFGDPLDATDYSLCLYEPSGDLVFAATAPAGDVCSGSPCWTVPNDRQVKYVDGSGTPDGLERLRLNKTSGRGSVVLRGKGPLLSARPLGLPVIQTPLALPVRVQMEAEDGWCWEAEYPSAKVNTGERFQARRD